MASKPGLSLVMPCYNEEACVEEVVSSWITEIQKRLRDFEMVVVNDGSKDRTAEILHRMESRFGELRVLTQENRGHGPALLNGYRSARGEWIFHTDSDNQFVPEDFWKLWGVRDRSPYVMGIRMHRDDPWHRLLLSRTLRWIGFILTGIRVHDINIPFKLIRRDLLGKILLAIPGDTFAPSILLAIGAHRLGVKITEIGVRHLPRKTGQTVLKPWKLAKSCARAFRQLRRFCVEFRPAARAG
ncbi:MAG TPA: glycosyltransferase family 2 protein [Bdellovibrionota bacterium]|nr:glycosyltransferase family 2 protein [Bdellovibrionota bacterium]